MTVEELIEELSHYEPSLDVYNEDGDEVIATYKDEHPNNYDEECVYLETV